MTLVVSINTIFNINENRVSYSFFLVAGNFSFPGAEFARPSEDTADFTSLVRRSVITRIYLLINIYFVTDAHSSLLTHFITFPSSCNCVKMITQSSRKKLCPN
jgi:hypothetical protein